MRSTSAFRRQRGFSLVEILVAITLSLIVLGGVMAVMYSSKVTYNENERVGRVQESGRAAMDIMLRDMRGAGFPGCSQPVQDLVSFNNLLNDPTNVSWNFAQPVFGYEAAAASWSPAINTTLLPDATPGNDIVVIRTIPAGSPVMRVPVLLNPTDDISVEKEADEVLPTGVPLVISDCGKASVFVASAFTDASTTADIERAVGGGTPSNATTELGDVFRVGARIAPIASIIYYVAPATSGDGTALWRVISDNAPQELVPGVEAMQVRYGIDTVTTDNNLVVGSYVDATAVTDWGNVIAIELAILVRSPEANSPDPDTRTYNLLGTDFGPYDDRFQRSLFSTTVALRNRTD